MGGGVKVADFGLARLLEHSVTGHTGSMTIAYAAPEFFRQETSDRSDQYSLAVTYCILRGGRLPFSGNHEQIMAGHVFRPPDLGMLPEPERPAVLRALAKQAKDRWPTCRAFVAELRSCRDAGEACPEVPDPVGTLLSTSSWPSRPEGSPPDATTTTSWELGRTGRRREAQ